MNTKLFTKENIMCAFAMILIVGCYAAQRIIEVAFQPDKTIALILAIIYTALLAVVFLLISKSKNSFFGILTALIGYKMMPPPLGFLASTTAEGYTLYYLVGRAAAVIFILIVYKLYKMQEEPHEIRSLPILAILLSVPFFNKIASVLGSFFMYKTGSMLYVYFTQFACYTVAVLVILAIAYNSGFSSMRFTAYFEFTALSINIFRQLGKIVYFAIAGEHISKSLYSWIAIFVVLMICFAVATNAKKKQLAKE